MTRRRREFPPQLRRDRLIRVGRGPLGDGALEGYIVAISREVVLLHVQGPCLDLDGYTAIRRADIRAVHAIGEDESPADRHIRRGDSGPEAPSYAAIGDFRAVLRSVGDDGEILTIHRERLTRNKQTMGIVADVTDRHAVFQVIDRAARECGTKRLSLSDITRVDFGSDYQDAIRCVRWADRRPPESPCREILYICYEDSPPSFWVLGMEFGEFIESFGRPLNLIVLEGKAFICPVGRYNVPVLMDEDIEEELLSEDINSWGDFSCLDFADLEGIKALTAQEMAELDFLGKRWEAVHAPFFDKLGNRFVYMAHDDGWVLRLMLRDPGEMCRILAGVVARKAAALTVRSAGSVPPVDRGACRRLLKRADQGLLLDFRALSKAAGPLEVPVYSVGPTRDMDAVLSDEVPRLGREHAPGTTLRLHRGAWRAVREKARQGCR